VITRIELTNFMSHTRTVIEPAAGLTVLVGPNNCGKSAVVAALQILCHNDNSTYVLRHGERECSVQVTTDDGHTIQWRRKTAPSYCIDGQLFDRLRGGGLPEELHKVLRLPLVEGGDDKNFDVHFGEQKSPIFLLGSPPSAAAKFFASSSDAIRLVEMQRRHKEKLTERQREKVRLEAESKRLNGELEVLQPVVELDRRLRDTELLYADLQHLAARIAEAGRDEEKLCSQRAVVERSEAETIVLSPLSSPPELSPTGELTGVVETLRLVHDGCNAAAARAKSLVILTPPPPLFEEGPLEGIVASLQELEHIIRRGEETSLAMLPLSEAPQLERTADVELLINSLIAGENEANRLLSRCSALAHIDAPPKIDDEDSLAAQITALSVAATQASCCEESRATISRLVSPSQPRDFAPLAEVVERIRAAAAQASEFERHLQAANQDLARAEASLRESAKNAICPTCGSPFDVDQLLTSAASGVGGHSHE
jgi:hypothetical protein